MHGDRRLASAPLISSESCRRKGGNGLINHRQQHFIRVLSSIPYHDSCCLSCPLNLGHSIALTEGDSDLDKSQVARLGEGKLQKPLLYLPGLRMWLPHHPQTPRITSLELLLLHSHVGTCDHRANFAAFKDCLKFQGGFPGSHFNLTETTSFTGLQVGPTESCSGTCPDWNKLFIASTLHVGSKPSRISPTPQLILPH